MARQPAGKRPPLPPLCEQYLREIVSLENKSLKTQEAYRLELTLFVDYLHQHREGKAITEVNRADVKAYIDHCRNDRGIAAVTAKRKLSVLKAFYKWAAENEYMEYSPADAVRLPKDDSSSPTYLKPHQKVKLRDTVLREPSGKRAAEAWERTWRRDITIIYVMMFCGLRIGEVVALNWSDVDFDYGQIKVRGKGAKERTIPLHPLAYKALRDLREFGPTSSSAIFVRTDNPNPEAIKGKRLGVHGARKAVKKHLVAAGLRPAKVREGDGPIRTRELLTPHKFRHTFATDLLMRGADIREIADLMGHECLETTKRYTHPTTERFQQLVERLGFDDYTE